MSPNIHGANVTKQCELVNATLMPAVFFREIAVDFSTHTILEMQTHSYVSVKLFCNRNVPVRCSQQLLTAGI